MTSPTATRTPGASSRAFVPPLEHGDVLIVLAVLQHGLASAEHTTGVHHMQPPATSE